MLRHLLQNALKHSPRSSPVLLRLANTANHIEITVRDEGIGIPADIRPHLFEPFFTNKPNGTGLGLSISAHIVTQHGGQIEVESSVGQGTTFRIVLPYQS